MLVVTVAEMREIEARAEREYGMSSSLMMEHAGRSIALAVRERAGGDVLDLRVLVLAGPGNNGGDGRVLARYLEEWGAEVTVYDWKAGELETGGQRVPVGEDLAPLREAVAQADVVADALLGTGHARPLAPAMAAALAVVRDERARRGEPTVLAVDLPSGLNADTGAVDPGTLDADLTVTLAYPKVGLFLFPGSSYVGQLEVGSIGLPPEMEVSAGMELLDDSLVRPLLPARPLDSNKGTFGKVLALCGSSRYIGAAYLVTGAAGRIGAGLVTLATLPAMAPYYATMLPEITYAPLPEENAAPEERANAVLHALEGYDALVVGPGLGQSEATREMLRRVFAGVCALSADQRPRLVVDADGLNNLSHMDAWWTLLPRQTVLTPHPGEMARLLGGQRLDGTGSGRIDVVRQAVTIWGHVLVLKGAHTLIGAPDQPLRINWPANPALATGGTGDVLAGTIGGLLAQGLAPFAAACAGVYVHGRAGLRVAEQLGDAGLLAGDLLPELPLALRAIKEAS